MKRSTKIYTATGALLMAVMLAWAFAPRPVEVELAPVRIGPFETTISEDGKTRLRERYVVSAPLAGRLSRIALTEGDRVDADAVIATLTPVLPPMLDERSLSEQTSRVEAARANVARAAVRTERARIALAQARNDLQRSEQLAAQGFVAPTLLTDQRLGVQAAQREVEAAVQEHHVSEHDLEQARAALLVTRGAAGGAGGVFELRAPISGLVLRVVQTSATTVPVGAPLIELGDLGQMEVVTELLTTDALSTPPGSPVRIENWGGPGTLEGRVRLVEPAAFTKISALGVEEQRVRVLIDITTPHSQWRELGDGFRVGVRILTMSIDKALTVPVSAVFPLPAESGDNAGNGAATGERDAVFVVEGGRARLRPVQIGARNGSRAWVRSGLDASARVIVYPGAAVTDGVRVQARKV